uniref:Uncharacterized protein n=1 Tax=Anguilla anguilla TaxID=7936 RepID=A0A0E9WPZ7_ANGAN
MDLPLPTGGKSGNQDRSVNTHLPSHCIAQARHLHTESHKHKDHCSTLVLSIFCHHIRKHHICTIRGVETVDPSH